MAEIVRPHGIHVLHGHEYPPGTVSAALMRARE